MRASPNGFNIMLLGMMDANRHTRKWLISYTMSNMSKIKCFWFFRLCEKSRFQQSNENTVKNNNIIFRLWHVNIRTRSLKVRDGTKIQKTFFGSIKAGSTKFTYTKNTKSLEVEQVQSSQLSLKNVCNRFYSIFFSFSKYMHFWRKECFEKYWICVKNKFKLIKDYTISFSMIHIVKTVM